MTYAISLAVNLTLKNPFIRYSFKNTIISDILLTEICISNWIGYSCLLTRLTILNISYPIIMENINVKSHTFFKRTYVSAFV
jgi:hypothetical protein